ncbi:MAG: alpha-2-macroglobulin [Planctomycetes bacterium]|nr:alpha-2-macroglobulin [Planctomycetota bacterium]
MLKSRKLGLFALALTLGLLGVWRLTAGTPSLAAQRTKLTKAYNDGNYKVAFEGLRALALNPKNDKTLVGKDLELAINALVRLGRNSEVDDFREAVIKVHAKNWRLLAAAAQTYNSGEHYGFMVAGTFQRGGHRGGGHIVNSLQRDRTRSLQLMKQALDNTKGENDRDALANFHLQFAHLILHGAGNTDAWRLQYLTDLSKLPDYEEGYWWHRHRNHNGAPVDADGNPILHKVPKSWDAAKSDGERWRWLLLQTIEFDSGKVNEVDMIFADFMRGQLGVQTMAYYGWRFGNIDDTDGDKKSGTFALHTLKDKETIARLATGLKRFTIPDEYNWIKIYQRIADRALTSWGERALGNLGQEFEDRRQYPRAATIWKRAIKDYGAGPNQWRQKRHDQIVNNWGRFENVQTQPAGTEPHLDFRFRNGNQVAFEAHSVDVPKLLNDVKAYLRANPGNRIDWNQVNVSNIGYRLVEKQQVQYLTGKVAAWNVNLKPRPKHVDDRITVKAPLKKPGAYLVTAQMANGNLSRILVWVNDTVIVKKQLDQKSLYFVADGVTGTPVPNAQVEFFGWRTVQVAPNVNKFNVVTTTFTAQTDKDGQVILGQDKASQNYQWLITATKAKAGLAGADRFAYMGFTYAWYGQRYDAEYNADRTFVITDRPVYRPEHNVQFKIWIQHSKYDQPNVASFAGQAFKVRITNPMNEKVHDKIYTADEYGGIVGEYTLPKGATLGVYSVQLLDPQGPPDRYRGGSSFRVEEYKKPEFEVKINAPTEPVKLGDKVTATIDARYYFGAPVTNAMVKYKVMRQSHSSRWYPYSRWDWMYGNGYWWFAPDYNWYPGFEAWGCRRPIMPWWGWSREQPEMVLENEVPIGADGKVEVVIDTATAKELHGNQDHKYTITAEVTDQSRRTIVGQGDVLVSRKAFKIYTWLDKGHYRTDDTIKAHFKAQTLDKKAVEGKGELTLFQISYNAKNEPVEKAVQTWKLDTNVEGSAMQQIKAAKAGQYRLSYKVTDKKKNTIEGGYLFLVIGEGFDSKGYRFNDIELITDKKEYNPGDKVKINVNVNQNNGTVLLFARPTNGVYLAPKVLRLKGKSIEEEITVVQRDMPNFFVEVLTVHGGRVHTETRELVVPPEKRIVNVEVLPNQQEYKPGEKATVKVRLTDIHGKPFVGSTVISVYDKSVEYISGGSNVPEIKEFFWKWRRHHYPRTESSLVGWSGNLFRTGEIGMSDLGVFGASVVEEMKNKADAKGAEKAMARDGAAAPGGFGGGGLGGLRQQNGQGADRGNAYRRELQKAAGEAGEPGNANQPGVEPSIRKNFADTAYWAGSLVTNKQGLAEVSFKTPDQLTAWKIRVWTMGLGTKVGQGEAEVVTKKDLIVRLQAPRFFVQKDEVVLSANVHNYLKAEKKVRVTLEFDGGTLSAIDPLSREVTIPSGGEKRVDWRVKVLNEGEAIVRMKAVTDDDADAMQMRFPCFVHGMLKMDSFTGVIRPEKNYGKVTFSVPAERRVNESVLEVRYTPTLAGAMIDALPYLVDYPYGCTEQTLNRFLPTVITQRVLQSMKLDLKEIEKHQTNLNAGELGPDKKRVADWKRLTKRNPVFNEEEVRKMSQAGINALASMQLSDGGWGWFSGWGERSWPHTTATVVHGLQLAKANDIALPPNMLERGVAWLQGYQNQQVRLLHNGATKTRPYKLYADNIDALVYMTLVDAKVDNTEMRDFLYRDRTHIAVYAKAMFGLALHKQGQKDKLKMILENIDSYVVSDDENQTAYLRMPESNQWWYWHGNEIEANAYYLKLLCKTDAKGERASRMVKYLLNNRRHATYWKSTRDTAICVEAFADYLKMSGEDRPDMTVEVWLDGKKHKEVRINKDNLFSFDNKLILTGDKVTTGKHTVEIKRKGSGPVYFNAYVTYFTLEDFITKAGLEVKVNRKYYKLTRVIDKIKASGSKGQALDQAVEKYTRAELPNLSTVKSGDLVEVELEIDSKNDYEYLIFEDPKAAGFEPMQVRSGYVPNTMGAYMELRDEKVAFFVRHLARGKHSIAYRMRAEIPGTFSALPTRGYAMYAPELKGNSDEIKIRVIDR